MADGVVNAWWDGDAVFVAERVGEVVQLKSHAAEHSCFVRHADLSRQLLKQLRDSGYVTRLSQEGEYVRICWLDRGAVARGCEWLEQEAKVKTFEGGISPVRRWCVDHEVWPVKPRACYLDIENDSDVPFAEKERARIFCVGVEDAETGAQRIFTLSDDDDAAERKMLAQLCEYLAGYDQVAIWNGDRFDAPAIKGRLKGLRMFDQLRELKRILFVDYMVIFKRMHVAESGDEKASMSLDNVCREVLGIGKVDFDASKTREAFDAGGTRRAEMFKYCLHDVHLMAMLEKRKGYLALHWSICEAMGVFPDTRGARPAGQVESFMLRMGREEGHKFPTRIAHEDAVDREEDQFRGAHVMAPPDKAGILKGVHVVDFSSLYPTIIITFNMSPETIREKPELEDPNFGRPAYLPKIPLKQVVLERPQECCEAPITGHWFDTTTIGLLPRAVQRLLDLRKKWSAKMASLPPGTPEWFDAYLRSQAYKVAANACFGVAGNKHSLIYDVRVAESIAQGGVWLIKHTLDAARKRGWNPLYADTDSGFIAGVSNEEFAAFRDWCNAELFPPLVAAQGCRVNRISIAYEKKFRRLVFSGKKRYVGAYEHYKGEAATAESKPEVKGLEYKRGDSTRTCRQMQRELIDLMMVKDCDDVTEYVALVERWRGHILNDELERDEFVLSQSLSRSLKDYARNTKKDGTLSEGSAHLAVARVLEKRGRDVGIGTRIDYVVTDASESPMKAIPLEDFKGDFDRHYLWESRVWPATERVLEHAFPAHDWSAYDKTRPPKPRGKGSRNLRHEGQVELGGLLGAVRK